jgi:hypothetical protein
MNAINHAALAVPGFPNARDEKAARELNPEASRYKWIASSRLMT